MGLLDKTYKMADNPPPPMPWDEYERWLKNEWQRILNSAENERDIQNFLEKHPCLIPGAFNMKGKSGHYPFPDAVISQPPLTGVGVKIPDFMWLSTNSLEFEPVVIEIESPKKKWFTSVGRPTSDFTEAQNQLAQWRAWFEEPENQLTFYKNFEIPQLLRDRKLRVSCVLIYGRRNEYENNTQLNKVRAQLARQDEHLMSFDRFTPSADAQYFFAVKRERGRYRAITYPPTYVIGPDFADTYSIIEGKNEAIDACGLMTLERKRFIKSRFPYWEVWSKQDFENKGVIFGGDRE
jgi:hypothetical protein